jgi:hypothetical protein
VTLDEFRRCSAPGCYWQVRFPSPIRCYEHFGPPFAQFITNEDGDILDAKFLPNADYERLE